MLITVIMPKCKCLCLLERRFLFTSWSDAHQQALSSCCKCGHPDFVTIGVCCPLGSQKAFPVSWWMEKRKHRTQLVCVAQAGRIDTLLPLSVHWPSLCHKATPQQLQLKALPANQCQPPVVCDATPGDSSGRIFPAKAKEQRQASLALLWSESSQSWKGKSLLYYTVFLLFWSNPNTNVKFKYLFIIYLWGKKTASMNWFTPQRSAAARTGPGWSQEFNPDLLYVWVPGHNSESSLPPPRVCFSGKLGLRTELELRCSSTGCG